MRDVPMTTYGRTIRVGTVDALLNVGGYELQGVECGCGKSVFIFLILNAPPLNKFLVGVGMGIRTLSAWTLILSVSRT